MSELTDAFFFKLACETPLPASHTVGRSADNPFNTKPYTRAQTRLEGRAGGLPDSHLATSKPIKKRLRESEFNIFVDVSATYTAPAPSPKKLRPNARVPLAPRTTSINAAPVCPLRHPNQPFPFSHSDPLWEDTDNYIPYYMTPPSTPGGNDPTSDRRSSTHRRGFSAQEGPFQTPPPSPFASQRSSTSRSSRSVRPRRAAATQTLPPLKTPRNTILYDVLQLSDWQATEAQIKWAYKQIAKGTHPDRVAEEHKEDATQFMQTVNAAKDVLLDDTRRRTYHNDGKLPWAT